MWVVKDDAAQSAKYRECKIVPVKSISNDAITVCDTFIRYVLNELNIH